MGKVVGTAKKLSLDEVTATIAFDQPKLGALQDGSNIVVRGSYLLLEERHSAIPDGPISEFDIRIILAENFPEQEPKVYEVGERIPRCLDRHMNSGGECCLTVWEHWLACTLDQSFRAFLNGPVKEFFLGQYWFEKTGEWPFGQRTHFEKGLEEAYADALRIANNRESIISYLKVLSKDWPKGHWPCPCGSGRPLRACHRNDMMALRTRIRPALAIRMLQRLEPHGSSSPVSKRKQR